MSQFLINKNFIIKKPITRRYLNKLKLANSGSTFLFFALIRRNRNNPFFLTTLFYIRLPEIHMAIFTTSRQCDKEVRITIMYIRPKYYEYFKKCYLLRGP